MSPIPILNTSEFKKDLDKIQLIQERWENKLSSYQTRFNWAQILTIND